MCMELRGASRKEMMAFIQGKRIPEKRDGNLVEIFSPGKNNSTAIQAQIGDSLKRRASPSASTLAKSSHQLPNGLATASSSANAKTTSRKTPKRMNPALPFGPVYSPGPVLIDSNTCNTWIYPRHKNFQIRQYQLEISQTAILYNTLVSLPTGLGKTLIAAVVMFNYYRWFPEGKVLFLAPTLPLVSQQAEACYNIMGIPEKDTAMLTGRIKPRLRFEMWRNRRVFYCTPQTVQKDLLSEDGTSFASKVCCIVLDEAHKASGDYAYTKVIEQLELAGAKFRIVGLSATPGTSIKAIQKVVESLRTVKIEARHEADPSVATYIHQKHSETVIVPKNESQKDVERRLTRMLEPILQNLKARGALKFTGINTTVTAFHIHKASEEYSKRNGNANGSLRAHFQAAYKLVELRNDACQSLGCVKLKIQRLKQTPQKGILARIISSTDFEELYQRVLEATSSTSKSSIEKFNPKLQKLVELLHEHFSRAKVGNRSSRAIIFSQYRDSVSEIVDHLVNYHPLIRARHFVGQQSSKRPAGNNDNRLGGMKQADQQKAIQRFRENIHNVLVCTCIGEEGLDIGDVDLIINFDSLRSPIRMIQRTGRTGRKRDGRVVSLVSEGEEERKHRASKQSEKTLTLALKKCGSFKMAAHRPMLPGEPLREFADIEITGSFRFSQVGHPASRRQTKVQSWNLSLSQEEERGQLLGNVISSSNDWETVRSVLLRGWCGSVRETVKGQSSQILQKLRDIGPVKAEKIPRRSLTCQTEHVFPVVRHRSYIRPIEQPKTEVATKLLVPFTTRDKGNNASGNACGPSAAVLLETVGRTMKDSAVNEERSNNDVGVGIPPLFRLPTPPASSGEEDITAEERESFCFRLPTPDSSSSEEEFSNNDRTSASTKTHGRTIGVSNMMHLQSQLEQHIDQETESPDTLQHSGSGEPDSTIISNTGENDRLDSLLDSLTKIDNSDAPLISLKRKAKDRPLIKFERQHQKTKMLKQCTFGKNFDVFSDSKRCKTATKEAEETPTDVKTKIPFSRSAGSIPCDVERLASLPYVQGELSAVPRKAPAEDHVATPTAPPCKVVMKQVVEDSSTENRSQQPSWGLPKDSFRCSNSPTSDIVESTFGCQQRLETPVLNSRIDKLGELTDTPDCNICINPDSMECALCCFGESSASNPIVLCDGGCNRGFHKRCCSIDIDLDSADRWICKECLTGKNVQMRRLTRKRAIQDDPSPGENIEVGSHPAHESESEHRNLERKRERLERLQARRLGVARFILDEAEIGANDDMEGDEADNSMVDALEEEECFSNDSFINDSTQLTQHYSGDELGKIDPHTYDNDVHHRNLDVQFDRENQFTVPVLNRRPAAECGNDSSEPSSQDGLGNMHFIRSVLQHHQQGGRAQEIETYFRNLQQNP